MNDNTHIKNINRPTLLRSLVYSMVLVTIQLLILAMLILREAMEQEKAQKLKEKEEEDTKPPAPMQEGSDQTAEVSDITNSGPAGVAASSDTAAAEDDEEKAAVVLQSNYRGYKERKKFKERKKTMAGEELAMPSTIASNDNEPEPSTTGRVVEKTEPAGPVGENQAIAEGEPDTQQEEKAATVLQSNFRGHKERQRLEKEGKLPRRGNGEQKSTPKESQDSPDVEEATEAIEVQEEGSTAKQGGGDAGKVQGEGSVGEEDEEKAAVVLQSNFRGHKERKKLQEEGKIPKKKEATPASSGSKPVPEPKTESELEVEMATECLPESGPQEPDVDPEEEKAATVIQSNFRGHRERKKLKEQREANGQKEKGCATLKEETGTEMAEEAEEALELTDIEVEHKTNSELEEEQQAAVKIQSNFRGHRDRKQMKANTQKEAEELEQFTKQVQ